MNTIDSLAFMFSLKIGRQCTPPTPPGMEKLKSEVNVTFWFWLMYPPPHNEKCGFQVKVTFCFWLMYPPPPPGMKKLDTGQSDVLVLADVLPPPEIEIGLNMNAIGTKIISREVIKYILPIYPPYFHYHYLILCLNRKLVNFNFKWLFGLELHPPPLSTQKYEMLIFGLCSTSDDRLG